MPFMIAKFEYLNFLFKYLD